MTSMPAPSAIFRAVLFLGSWFLILAPLPARGATLNAASCNLSDVQAQVDLSADGDTVVIPAGSCTWTAGISTSKSITIRGAGSALLTISLSGSGFGALSMDGLTAANVATISGMTLDGADLSIESSAIMAVSGPNAEPAFRVTDVRFVNLCGAGGSGWRGITVFGIHGVIDDCTFTKSASRDCSMHAIDADGPGFSGDLAEVPWGTDGALFVENVTFDYCGGSDSDGAYDMYFSGSLVVRHSRFLCVGAGGHGFDSGSGAFFMENYANIFENTKTDAVFEALGSRGGTGAAHDNLVVDSGGNYNAFWQLRLYRPVVGLSRGAYWGGTGFVDGNADRMCDVPSSPGYIDVCTTDADCPYSGSCGAVRLCRRTSDDIMPLVGFGESYVFCALDGDCANYVTAGALPPGTYTCSGSLDGDLLPHPTGTSSGTATGASATSLTVDTTSWAPDEWRLFFAYNDTDGSRCLVTSNTGNTITCSGIQYMRDDAAYVIPAGTIHGDTSGATATVSGYTHYDPSWYGGESSLGFVTLAGASGTFLEGEYLHNQDESVIGYTMSGYGLYRGSDNTWTSGDSYHLSIGYPAREGFGRGQYGALDPIYAWNNTYRGTTAGHINLVNYGGNSLQITQEGRDYYNIEKPGHTDYACPHPLTGLTGSCDRSIPGPDGYNVSVPAPAAPTNLTVL